MLKRVFSLFFVILFFAFFSCKKEDTGDDFPPTVMTVTPSEGATDVDTSTVIQIKFTEQIILKSNHQIKLNNTVINATVDARTLIINTTLLPGTNYILNIPANTILDVDGNAADEITLNFTTAKSVTPDGTIYEAENATLSGDASLAGSSAGYSGTGYVNTNAGNVTFTVNIPETGYYDLFFRYLVRDPKNNLLYVDGTMVADIYYPATTVWKELKAGMLKLTAGSHTFSFVKSWGYTELDYARIQKNNSGPVAFNIASAPATTNASAQAVKLYNYLKSSFGTKIISGAMAAHSTNINEAIWIHDNAGKWPAFTFFDFIDHTNLNQNWVKYNDPFTLGQEWWNNNGVVGFSWHWRDPLTKSGSFNTSETSFDVTKVTDTSSAEYKAMIVDIDVIAGYLKQFKEANIPVIWRPLHEAEGGWFWWGAKGAEPCKALWRLLFDRLVNHHGLNNLIWVWTTSASDNAANWYPGDEYVDVLGMDIYPGSNQHGSQYISFNKVREFTGGKKMITLSECGSVPDPAVMLEYGDTWSWFMPWNGDYTRSDSHNGAAWWQKFFSYDYVVTRDMMPSLK